VSHIDNTWLAYAFETEVEPGEVEAGLRRVASHYGGLFADPLVPHAERHGPVGMALWHRDDPRLRWPLWAEDEALTVAATNAPTGWTRLVGDAEPERAPLPLARALAKDPARLAELNPPFVISILDRRARRLTVVNDFLATGRLYELRTGRGWVWSNRLGALPLFAGVRPEADPEAWQVLAAAGWFLGRHTPIRGAEKVMPGSAIVADAGEPGGGTRVRRWQTDAVRDLVRPRMRRFRRADAKAAQQAVDLAHAVDQLWTEPPILNFSGGRDSRVSAAAAIAARLPATYRTMDIQPGEVDVVRQLVRALPEPIDHRVAPPERGEPDDDLADRLRDLHLVHDGLNNPMSAVRAPLQLPQEDFAKPLITGHGGELAHGFYYTSEVLPEIHEEGRRGLIRRLKGFARKNHRAARREAYAAYAREARRTLEEGREHGVDGPSLLDYFYMAQRLSFRAGLGSRNDRYSACTTPGFIRAAFDLAPEERVEVKVHRAIIDRLVPSWNEVPFFHGAAGRLPEVNRDRIWEKPRHAGQLEEILEEESLWGDLFVPEKVRRMWAKVKGGKGNSNYEPLFMAITWRVSFEDHLRLLGDRATGDPAPATPLEAGAARE
jgi:hypothetical protein